MKNLLNLLKRIDGKGYKAYKELERKEFLFEDIKIRVSHVQGDPFATPSVMEISAENKFSRGFFDKKHKKIALEDFLIRSAYKKANNLSQKSGTGHSGEIVIPKPSQEVLERSTLTIYEDRIVLRVFGGLPAFGRKIAGDNAIKLFKNLFTLGKETLYPRNYEEKELSEVITLSDEQAFIRKEMKNRGIVAFIANGSILPRRSGISDLPMQKGAVPFRSPKSMEVSFELPDGKNITGMGIKKGITLIAGGGYHGKTTLLKAIQRGIYDHVKGDGREFVFTDKTAIKIRTEDGRSVKNADIFNFIRNIPGKTDTHNFSTENASGSTSMASALFEAMETGSKLILIDEDTSATNFMIRDARMQKLVQKEPIIPLIDRLRELFEKFGISSILVIGGAGDYLDVCDRVIVMENYIPLEKTEYAKMIAQEMPSGRNNSKIPQMEEIKIRILDTDSIQREKVKTHGKETLRIGKEFINTAFVEEFAEEGQLKTVGLAITNIIANSGKRKFPEITAETEKILSEKGLNILFNSFIKPGFSMVRKFEIASVLNRMRNAKFG
jgi:predicted ABC-class ATPase